MEIIKESIVSILEWLHDYRFLTVRQMAQMGVVSQHTIYQEVKNLQKGKRKYIDWVDFGARPEFGRIERLIYLTKHGAELLAEALQLPVSEISYPKGTRPRLRDLPHRIQTVDLHIMARTYCKTHNAELDFFTTYFEYSGANNRKDLSKPTRKAVNTIQIVKDKEFIPDCIFQITNQKGKSYLFTAEIYRNHNTKRTHRQIQNHLEALGNNSISKRYKFPHAVQVLILCDRAGAMKALQKSLNTDPAFKESEDYFLFRLHGDSLPIHPKKTPPQKAGLETRAKIQSTLQDFSTGWQTFTGKGVTLFAEEKKRSKNT